MEFITDLGPFTVRISDGVVCVIGANGGEVCLIGESDRFAARRVAEAVAATLNNERLHDGQANV